MKKSITYSVITLLILGFCLPMKAQILPHSPMRETRAVWLTTFLGLDWPKTKARDEMGINAQKAELCAMLDKLEAAGINTVLFQTRIRGTVIYPSRIEPWDACLTGKEGRAPGYDPLQFAIDECHRRGMAFHAWVVAMKVGDKTYLDPSDTSVGAKLSAICCEIAARYDVDGISFDYLRYPEDPKTINDKKKHAANGRGLTYSDWRRDNVTRIVRKVYNDIKAVKPYLWVTSSPVGKYSDVAGQSAGGWNARNRVYQDIERWMNEGIHDGIYPMMYFKDNNFYPFALQWA
ncbi:MAG: family 10 glycosylhydrolase, partial [Bacteroidaceae bacterium]|nr:family 10 glycosylhydrolase [Bacteroidaceae bacterium]